LEIGMAWPFDMGLRTASLRLRGESNGRAEDASDLATNHRIGSFRRALAVGNLALVAAVLLSFAHAAVGASNTIPGMSEAAAAGAGYPIGLLVFTSAIASLVLLWSSGSEKIPQRQSVIAQPDVMVQQHISSPSSNAFAGNEMAGLLSSMGHELRTPLNAIIGFSDMMQQEMHGPLGSDRYQTYATHIRDSGLLLLGAIETTLALTERLSVTEQAAHLSEPAQIVRGFPE
jgi:signal transduction histidine kinase